MDPRKFRSLKQKISEKYNFQRLLAAGHKSQVQKHLIKIITAFAEKRKFAEAEYLRKWLIEIDQTALKVIIRSAEVIEDAKAATINDYHFEIWKSLTRLLTREEFSALYHALIIKNYPSGKNIIRQGTYFPALLFINQGRIQLSTLSDGKKVLLKTAIAGEVIGGSTFFEPSSWTFDLISEGVELAVLSYKKQQHLHKEYPALVSKLFDFCATFAEPDTILRTARKGRRSYFRSRIDGRTALVLLDKTGVSTGTGIKGDLFDISKGGISCLIRTSQKHNAVKLFGRKIRATLPAGRGLPPLNKNGVIVAVKGQRAAGNEYSLHVEFEKELDDFAMKEIVYG